jgi:hypothetical protein
MWNWYSFVKITYTRKINLYFGKNPRFSWSPLSLFSDNLMLTVEHGFPRGDLPSLFAKTVRYYAGVTSAIRWPPQRQARHFHLCKCSIMRIKEPARLTAAVDCVIHDGLQLVTTVMKRSVWCHTFFLALAREVLTSLWFAMMSEPRVTFRGWWLQVTGEV